MPEPSLAKTLAPQRERRSAVSGPVESPLDMHGLYGNDFVQTAMRTGLGSAAGVLAPGLLDLVGSSLSPDEQADAVDHGAGLQELPVCELGSSEEVPVAADRGTGGGVQLLVGGPFVDGKGVEHRYGHAALRVFDAAGERDTVYDFGRYGDTNGRFSAEGEGILREWDDSIDEYMDLQNAKGRETTGYTFPASDEEVQRAFEMFDAQIAEAELRKSATTRDGELRVNKLQDDYHGVHHNCTTLSIDGFERARPDIDLDVAAENQGRGMSRAERFAAQNVEGWHDEIFMPADLDAVLEQAVTDDVLVERWAPNTAQPYEVLNEAAMTCMDPAFAADEEVADE